MRLLLVVAVLLAGCARTRPDPPAFTSGRTACEGGGRCLRTLAPSPGWRVAEPPWIEAHAAPACGAAALPFPLLANARFRVLAVRGRFYEVRASDGRVLYVEAEAADLHSEPYEPPVHPAPPFLDAVDRERAGCAAAGSYAAAVAALAAGEGALDLDGDGEPCEYFALHLPGYPLPPPREDAGPQPRSGQWPRPDSTTTGEPPPP